MEERGRERRYPLKNHRELLVRISFMLNINTLSCVHLLGICSQLFMTFMLTGFEEWPPSSARALFVWVCNYFVKLATFPLSKQQVQNSIQLIFL